MRGNRDKGRDTVEEAKAIFTASYSNNIPNQKDKENINPTFSESDGDYSVSSLDKKSTNEQTKLTKDEKYDKIIKSIDYGL